MTVRNRNKFLGLLILLFLSYFLLKYFFYHDIKSNQNKLIELTRMKNKIQQNNNAYRASLILRDIIVFKPCNSCQYKIDLDIKYIDGFNNDYAGDYELFFKSFEDSSQIFPYRMSFIGNFGIEKNIKYRIVKQNDRTFLTYEFLKKDSMRIK